MYNTIKKVIAAVLPKRFLVKNEQLFRKIYYLFYIGNKHQCTICLKKNRSFVENHRGEKLCPNCGSMPRDRRLYLEFNKMVAQNRSITLLEFSPSRSLYRTFKKRKNITYYPTDLSTDFIAEYKYDITNIPIENDYFDFILCYHILEHVENDIQAMTELYRVLSPTGKVFVQTPFKAGEIYENPAITTPEERLKHFGQADHVRIYSIEGLKKRLSEAGFHVQVHTFEADEYHGLNDNETILELSK